MSEYREGDGEEVLREQEEDETKELSKPVNTAFVIVMYEDGTTDVAVKLPYIKMKRSANTRDIRNACRLVYDDMSLMISAEATARMVQQGLANYAAMAMEQQQYNKIVSNLNSPNPGNFLKKV